MLTQMRALPVPLAALLSISALPIVTWRGDHASVDQITPKLPVWATKATFSIVSRDGNGPVKGAPANIHIEIKALRAPKAGVDVNAVLSASGLKPDGDALAILYAVNPSAKNLSRAKAGQTVWIPVLTGIDPKQLLASRAIVRVDCFEAERRQLNHSLADILESLRWIESGELRSDANSERFVACARRLRSVVGDLIGRPDRPGPLTSRPAPVLPGQFDFAGGAAATAKQLLEAVRGRKAALPPEAVSLEGVLADMYEVEKAVNGSTRGPGDLMPDAPEVCHVRFPVLRAKGRNVDPELDGYFVFWEGFNNFRHDGGKNPLTRFRLGRSRGVSGDLSTVDLYVWACRDADGAGPALGRQIVKVRRRNPGSPPAEARIYVP
jgi:hypothetical protein